MLERQYLGRYGWDDRYCSFCGHPLIEEVSLVFDSRSGKPVRQIVRKSCGYRSWVLLKLVVTGCGRDRRYNPYLQF